LAFAHGKPRPKDAARCWDVWQRSPEKLAVDRKLTDGTHRYQVTGVAAGQSGFSPHLHLLGGRRSMAARIQEDKEVQEERRLNGNAVGIYLCVIT